MTVDIDYHTDKPYKISLYFVDMESAGRRSAIELFDLQTKRLLSPVHMVRNYENGRYVTFEADRPVRIRICQKLRYITNFYYCPLKHKAVSPTS